MIGQRVESIELAREGQIILEEGWGKLLDLIVLKKFLLGTLPKN